MSKKYLFIFLSSLLLTAFLMGGFLLPARKTVTNEIVINLTPQQIYPFLIDLRQWQHWSIWSTRIDATMHFEFPSENEMRWTSKYAGSGNMKITEALPDSELHTLLTLQNGNFSMPGIIRLQVITDGQTKILWNNTIDSGNNPLRRYMSYSVKNVVHRDIDECLKGLKNFILSQSVS
jgi:hypothetical protein